MGHLGHFPTGSVDRVQDYGRHCRSKPSGTLHHKGGDPMTANCERHPFEFSERTVRSLRLRLLRRLPRVRASVRRSRPCASAARSRRPGPVERSPDTEVRPQGDEAHSPVEQRPTPAARARAGAMAEEPSPSTRRRNSSCPTSRCPSAAATLAGPRRRSARRPSLPAAEPARPQRRAKWRGARRACRRAAVSLTARISAARRAAFLAPSMATVATGMPLGHLHGRVERVDAVERTT